MNKIYWYKLESMFGPGHMGTKIKYLPFNEELSQDYMEDIESEEAWSVSVDYDCSCITTMTKADKVPEKEKEEIRLSAERGIRAANFILSALEQA